MKKYGDDADSFHDQGTRVEISKQWHEQNTIKPNYNYHSTSKPKTTNKTTYESNYYYSQHRKRQSRTSSYGSYNNQGYQKRQSYRVNSVKKVNRKSKQNTQSTYSSNSDGGWVIALLFICGLLSIFISVYIRNIIAFIPIFVVLTCIISIIGLAIEKTTKKISSFKTNEIDKNTGSDYVNEWKTCPCCGHKLIKVQKKCPYCKYVFE